MGKFLWEDREQGVWREKAKKNLVFHFGVGRQASSLKIGYVKWQYIAFLRAYLDTILKALFSGLSAFGVCFIQVGFTCAFENCYGWRVYSIVGHLKVWSKTSTLQTQTLYSSQGTPCESITTGKNLFSLQRTPVLIAGSLFSLQGFPCKPLYFPDCSAPCKFNPLYLSWVWPWRISFSFMQGVQSCRYVPLAAFLNVR